MLFDKKFDLVISIGEDCACASYLRDFNLRDMSYPFDWWSRDKVLTDDQILSASKRLNEKFKAKNIYLLIFENNNELDQEIEKVELSSNIIKFISFFSKFDKENPATKVLGNVEFSAKVFKDIKLKRKVIIRIKESIINRTIKFCCMFIPQKQTRRELRAKLLKLFFED